MTEFDIRGEGADSAAVNTAADFPRNISRAVRTARNAMPKDSPNNTLSSNESICIAVFLSSAKPAVLSLKRGQ